jgi:hypothetical protein
VEPLAPPRAVKATGEKASVRKLALSGKKLKMVSDIKLNDNVTISVITRNKGEEEGDPFRPSRKLLRSPTAGARADIEVVEESEDSYGIRDSDHSTPVAARGGAPGKQQARKVMEKSGRLRSTKAERASEADDSARDDTQASDIDEEDAMISRAELKGFTQALAGAVQVLNVVVRKFKLGKGKDKGVREIGNLMIKGNLSSLEQCGEQKPRRRKNQETKKTVDKGECPKRKVLSPGEIMRGRSVRGPGKDRSQKR